MSNFTLSTKKDLFRIEMKNIVKCFPGIKANSNVCFDVDPGEVHALLGENGAGKSTLMRQLYGMYSPDDGEIIINGKARVFRSPADAIKVGIGMIHQHFMLVPTLTIAQNIALGDKSAKWPLVDIKGITKSINMLAEAYSLKVDPNAYVWQLSVGEQQRVEILKTLYRRANVIILDEPTAVLTPQEVAELFSTLKKMTAEGHSLIFISHKLHEVLEISDRITVLRDGRVIGSCLTKEATRDSLVKMMVGREVKKLETRPKQEGKARLIVKNLRAIGDRGIEALKGLNFEIKEGEILGIAGVSGNGQKELCQCLAGLRQATMGEIYAEGQNILNFDLNARVALGMAFVPEERMRDGAIGEFSVEENLFLHDRKDFASGIFLKFSKMHKHAKDLVNSYEIKTKSLDSKIKNLSGGNIQKTILARELSRGPKILIAAQPTRGVDIGAATNIHEKIIAQRALGLSIMIVSEDLDEIMALSDRIAVMYEGKIMDILDRNEASIEKIGLLMAGIVG